MALPGLGGEVHQRGGGALGAAHVDLVALEGDARHGAEDALRGPEGAGHPGAGLFPLEHRVGGEQAQAGQRAAPLHPVGVGDGLSQHLIAAADAHHRAAGGGVLEDGGLYAALPQPAQVVHGVLGAGEHHQIRPPQLPGRGDIAEGDGLHPLQGVEVGEVGQAGQAHHRDVHQAHLAGVSQPGGQGVLVVHIHIQHGDNPQHRLAGELLQLPQAGPENVHIPPEFVDNQALDQVLLVGLQQLHRAVEGGEHAPPVDVAAQEHRGLCPLGHAHVHDVVLPQVDLRRAARPLDDDDVVVGGQGLVGGHDLGDQGLAVVEILPRRHGAPGHAVDNHLGAHVAGGLEEDGVHPGVGGHPRRLGLHHLGPAHLQPVGGDGRVEGHVLGLEGGHPVAVLLEDAAQPRRQQGLARVGRRPLYHNRLCHHSTSLKAASSRRFCSVGPTHTRYQSSPRPW